MTSWKNLKGDRVIPCQKCGIEVITEAESRTLCTECITKYNKWILANNDKEKTDDELKAKFCDDG